MGVRGHGSGEEARPGEMGPFPCFWSAKLSGDLLEVAKAPGLGMMGFPPGGHMGLGEVARHGAK